MPNNRQARRAEARWARQVDKKPQLNRSSPGNGKWYQSTLLWGTASVAVAFILPVLAIMKDTRWFLMVAWPFVIIAVWEISKNKNLARPQLWTAGSGLVSALFLIVLYIYLAPLVVLSEAQTPLTTLQTMETLRTPSTGFTPPAQQGMVTVSNEKDCPPGYSIFSSNLISHNGTGISAPVDAKICLVKNSITDNGTGIELRPSDR